MASSSLLSTFVCIQLFFLPLAISLVQPYALPDHRQIILNEHDKETLRLAFEQVCGLHNDGKSLLNRELNVDAVDKMCPRKLSAISMNPRIRPANQPENQRMKLLFKELEVAVQKHFDAEGKHNFKKELSIAVRKHLSQGGKKIIENAVAEYCNNNLHIQKMEGCLLVRTLAFWAAHYHYARDLPKGIPQCYEQLINHFRGQTFALNSQLGASVCHMRVEKMHSEKMNWLENDGIIDASEEEAFTAEYV